MGELERRVETDVELVGEFVERCLDDDYRELVDEYVADEFVGYASGVPEPFHGREGLKQALGMLRSGFSDATSEVADIRGDGDTVAVRWIMRGIHEGEFMNVEPTGTQIEVDGMEFNRVKDGKLVESRIVWDVFGLLGQLGALPDDQAA